MGELSEKFEEVSRFFQRPINEVLPPSLLLYLVPPLPSFRLAAALLVLAVLLSLRVWWILPARKSRTKSRVAAITKPQDPWTVGVFLGSGGHTTELLQLVSALPTERYTQRIYLLSSGDRFSLHKAQDLERTLSCGSTDKPMAKTIQIPRARKVHQRFLTTPLTLARSVLFCIDHIAIRPLLRKSVGSSDKRQSSKGILADVLLMNGPGTCVPIVASVYLLRVSRPMHFH